jgi:hypothetical protein
MGYIREPKNVDLLVGPSVFNEGTKNRIIRAIAQYKKTGEKPVSIEVVAQGSFNSKTYTGPSKSSTAKKVPSTRKKVKI